MHKIWNTYFLYITMCFLIKSQICQYEIYIYNEIITKRNMWKNILKEYVKVKEDWKTYKHDTIISLCYIKRKVQKSLHIKF